MRGHLIRRLSMSALGAALAATAVLPATSSASAAPTGSWDLVFADDFNNGHLDTNKWHTCFFWAPETCSIEPNNELELYTEDNVSVSDGALKMQARKENATAWNGETYNYTSGMVSTGGSPWSSPAKDPGFVFQYGYVEARVKIPAGQGLWPAVWLLPDSHTWPPEIDIMEILGDDPNTAHMHYHYNDANGQHRDSGGSWTGPDFSAGWHTFAVDWQPDSITWYIDGVQRRQFTGPEVTDEPSYVLLNLAVGGNWPGAPDASTVFPADYLVDYVHVYQRAGEPDSTPAPAPQPEPSPDPQPTPEPEPELDTQSPAASVSIRSAGRRGVDVAAVAEDNVGVVSMQLLIDGVVRKTVSSDALSYRWKTRRVARGDHAITVRAWDAAGNVGTDTVTYRR